MGDGLLSEALDLGWYFFYKELVALIDLQPEIGSWLDEMDLVVHVR